MSMPPNVQRSFAFVQAAPDPFAVALQAWMDSRPCAGPSRHLPRIEANARGRYFLAPCPACDGTTYHLEPQTLGHAARQDRFPVSCEDCGLERLAGVTEAPGAPNGRVGSLTFQRSLSSY